MACGNMTISITPSMNANVGSVSYIYNTFFTR